MKVVLASQNSHKLAELREILTQYGLEIILESDLGLRIEVEETGSTFEENSMLKAQAVMRATHLPTIADDSGLQVDALDGAPGIYSARYGGEGLSGLDYLLKQMEGIPLEKRTARFVCVITLLRPDGTSIVARGTCEGRITTERRGEGGFGYDPVFYVPGEGCTYAQMPKSRKNRISHRANALRAFVAQLKKEEQTDADK